MAIGEFFSSLGDRMVNAGAAGTNPAGFLESRNKSKQNLQKQKTLQQIGEVMFPSHDREGLQALSFV